MGLRHGRNAPDVTPSSLSIVQRACERRYNRAASQWVCGCPPSPSPLFEFEAYQTNALHIPTRRRSSDTHKLAEMPSERKSGVQSLARNMNVLTVPCTPCHRAAVPPTTRSFPPAHRHRGPPCARRSRPYVRVFGTRDVPRRGAGAIPIHG